MTSPILLFKGQIATKCSFRVSIHHVLSSQVAIVHIHVAFVVEKLVILVWTATYPSISSNLSQQTSVGRILLLTLVKVVGVFFVFLLHLSARSSTHIWIYLPAKSDPTHHWTVHFGATLITFCQLSWQLHLGHIWWRVLQVLRRLVFYHVLLILCR